MLYVGQLHSQGRIGRAGVTTGVGKGLAEGAACRKAYRVRRDKRSVMWLQTQGRCVMLRKKWLVADVK